MSLLCFRKEQPKFNKKRACKLNSKVQNNYFRVKIGFKILTTMLRKQPLLNLIKKMIKSNIFTNIEKILP